MNSKTPNVNFMLNYYNCNYKNEKYKKKRAYYSSQASKDYMNYVATGIEDIKNLDYVKYMSDVHKSSGVFNENGLISAEQKQEVRSTLKATKSVIWDGIISFEERFGKKWCNTYEQAYELLKTELPKFFKRAGLSPENIEWFAGLHENTDNRHIHICFFEKEPVRIKPNKNEKQFSVGKISLNAINQFKANLEFSASDFKTKEKLYRLMINEQFKEELENQSTTKLNELFLNLANNFPTTGSLSYESKNMQLLKSQIDNITNYILNKSSVAKSYYDNFIFLAKEKDILFLNYCLINGYKKSFDFEKTYKQDIYRRLGNVVINAALNLKKINLERLQLNAKYRKEKILSHKKLKYQLQECLWLSRQIEYESIRAFDEFIHKLEEANFKNLIEQGKVDFEM
ncbi:MAG: relaxase MobL [Spirochaetales bacterium]